MTLCMWLGPRADSNLPPADSVVSVRLLGSGSTRPLVPASQAGPLPDRTNLLIHQFVYHSSLLLSRKKMLTSLLFDGLILSCKSRNFREGGRAESTMSMIGGGQISVRL